jgi:hypothetical protein
MHALMVPFDSSGHMTTGSRRMGDGPKHDAGSATLTAPPFVTGSVMSIEPVRDVRRKTADETAWFVAGGLLIVAGLITAASVLRQWSVCESPASQACLTLKQTMNMLPIQADTIVLRVPWAAPLAALALTLATAAWIALLLLNPFARSLKIFGAVVAVPLVVMSIGGWFGVWSVESWVARGGTWIVIGTISEFLALGFLVYATMSRYPVNLVTTQRLVVLLFGVTAFGTMHQSAEFILLGLADQAATGVPQYLGLGTALTLVLTGAGVIVLTLRARRNPHAGAPSIAG